MSNESSINESSNEPSVHELSRYEAFSKTSRCGRSCIKNHEAIILGLILIGLPLLIAGYVMMEQGSHEICPGSVVDAVVQLAPPANLSIVLPACINITTGLVLSTYEETGIDYYAGFVFFAIGATMLDSTVVIYLLTPMCCDSSICDKSAISGVHESI